MVRPSLLLDPKEQEILAQSRNSNNHRWMRGWADDWGVAFRHPFYLTLFNQTLVGRAYQSLF